MRFALKLVFKQDLSGQCNRGAGSATIASNATAISDVRQIVKGASRPSAVSGLCDYHDRIEL